MNKILAIIFMLTLSIANAAPTEYQVVMPFPPGGATDVTFKQFQNVVESGGQVKFDVDYKVGAGGLVAMKHFLSSDKTNLLLWSGSSLTIANEVLKKQPEFTDKDFKTVVMTERTPMLIVRSPKSTKVKTLNDLYSPTCNERLVVAIGGINHEIAGRLLEKTSTCKISLISYQGEPPLIADLLNGSVDLAVMTVIVWKHVVDQGGSIVTTTADIKDPEWSQYPALASKIPNAVVYSNFGLLARTDISDSQLNYLTKSIKSSWSNTKVRNTFVKPLPGVTTMELYGKDYHDVINHSVRALTQLSRQYDFQR